MFSKAPLDGPDKRLARYDHLIIHCTASPPNVDVDARWVDRVHRQRGFKNGCGYHAVVTRKGDWQDRDDGHPTREIGKMGAHVGDCGAGWNERSFGVSLAGGVDKDNRPAMNFTANQMDMLEHGIEAFFRLHPAPGRVTLLGHRDLIKLCKAPPKACPSFDVREWWGSRGHMGLVGRAPLTNKPIKIDGPNEDALASPNRIMILPEAVVVQRGDTLSAIALHYGITVKKILELNQKQSDFIKVGEVLRLK